MAFITDKPAPEDEEKKTKKADKGAASRTGKKSKQEDGKTSASVPAAGRMLEVPIATLTVRSRYRTATPPLNDRPRRIVSYRQAVGAPRMTPRAVH